MENGWIFVEQVYGDYVFWDSSENAHKDFDKCVHELRKHGYRKINQEWDCMNYYEYYRKKGKKKIITVTYAS